MADFKYTSLFYNSSIDKIQLVRKILQDNDYAKLCKIEAQTPTTFKGLLSLSFLRRKNYHSINRSNASSSASITWSIWKVRRTITGLIP